MGREQDIFQFVEGVVGGEGLFVEYVEGCAFDFVLRKGVDHGALVDYGAAAYVDDYGGGFHGGEFGFVDQADCFGVERRGHDHVVALRQHCEALIRVVNTLRKWIGIILRWRMALDGEDVHAHGADSGGDRATDVTVSNDTYRLAGNREHIERLPLTGHLIANHAAKIFGEIEDYGESKLAERRAENAAAVGHDDIAGDQFGKKRALEAR